MLLIVLLTKEEAHCEMNIVKGTLVETPEESLGRHCGRYPLSSCCDKRWDEKHKHTRSDNVAVAVAVSTVTVVVRPLIRGNAITHFLVARSSDGQGRCADDDMMSGCKVEQQSRWRQLRQRDKKRTPLDVLRIDKVDPLIHTEHLHSGGANTVSSFRRSLNNLPCQHATFCGIMSTYGFLRTRWICDIIMFLLIKSVAIKVGMFQGFFSPSSNKSPCT